MGLLDSVFSASNPDAVKSISEGKIYSLDPQWQKEQVFILAEKAPESLEELKQLVDVKDPRSVCAYWVYAVMVLTLDYDIGMSMMKYLYADIEPFGSGFIEGGGTGRAGWELFLNDRLNSDDYRWLPRAYFVGSVADNGFHPSQPLSLDLHYNEPNTITYNSQSFEKLGRLNIVYWVESNAAGNKANITISHFDGSDRWYVTSGATSALFYDQRAGLTAAAKAQLY